MSDDLKRLLEQVHEGVTSFDYDRIRVPCLELERQQFDGMISKVAGKPVSVETNLNILQDGLGHVFVEVSLDFSDGEIGEKFLINASTSLEFFELLADTSMLALSPPRAQGEQNVFMIQLPRPEKAADALEMIRRGLESGKS